MSSSCRKWQQDTLRYLQRECLLRLVVVRCQELWRNRSSEFYNHSSICSSANTTNSLLWDRHVPHRKHRFQLFLHCCIDAFLNNGSGIVACLQSCCLETCVFAEPPTSNGHLCWLHSSCFEQICHIILFPVLLADVLLRNPFASLSSALE
jgi:hypothetical protein